LIAMASAILFITSCGDGSVMMPVSEVCRNPERSRVRVRGYLRLPISQELVVREPVRAEEQRLIIVEKSNGTGAFVSTTALTTNSAEPNRIGSLPISYTYDDLHIFTDSGRQVSADEVVNVTGEVMKTEVRCVLKVTKIEAL